ncbi:TetR/AcrR family transcriptional regulator [Nocardioides sp. Bht2]|uniref:TetR/AcrR family transcriptional regulator n=1 Tax=Nocardioides sp. Bht2 TaxID=3392297 RepID=UPI0039B69076
MARRPYAARLPLAERREQLLDAALAVITRDGYGAVSIEAVAQEAGVTRPVVYGAYDTLSDLLIALLDRQQARLIGLLIAALPEAFDERGPEDVVEESVRAMVAAVVADPETWRPVLFANDATPAEVRDRIAADREMVRQRIAELIGELLPWPEVDTEVLSHAVVAILEHFARLLIDDPERFDADRLVASVRQIVRMVR